MGKIRHIKHSTNIILIKQIEFVGIVIDPFFDLK